MSRGRKLAIPHNSKSLLAVSDRLMRLADQLRQLSMQMKEKEVDTVMVHNPVGIDDAFKVLQKLKRDIDSEIAKALDEQELLMASMEISMLTPPK